MIVGIEVGENGTPHLQGYVRFQKKKRFNAVKKIVGNRTHIEQAKDTEGDNEEYCKKGVIAIEVGTLNKDIGEKGCSSAQSVTIHKIISQRLDGVPPYVIAAGEDVACHYKYEKQIEHTVKQFKQSTNIQDLQASYKTTMWRLWQLKLVEELQREPQSRNIIWYVDEVGNSGKTFLTKYLITEGDTIRFENGKGADIKFAYKGEKLPCLT